ncbi:hypothetical protein JOE48_000134 [Methylobacterium sp. PvR107]|nr:hypothetical protein [Methylobacterium sp. PvR107]MBP1178170.1 hypothetical protein [Methylobacterium sp. PvR107]
MRDRQSCLVTYDERPETIHIDGLQVIGYFADDGSGIGQRLLQVLSLDALVVSNRFPSIVDVEVETSEHPCPRPSHVLKATFIKPREPAPRYKVTYFSEAFRQHDARSRFVNSF